MLLLAVQQVTRLYICGGLVAKSCPTVCILWPIACQTPLSIGFSRQEYWSGLPFSTARDLSNSWIEATSPVSPHWQAGRFLTTESPPKPQLYIYVGKSISKKAVAPHSSTLAWKNPMDGGTW